MNIDAELVTRKLSLIGGDLGLLREVRARGLAPYLASPMDQAVVERLLERVATRMIDINYHLITADGQPPPRDYHASFLELGALSILPPEFARRIAKAAGLRNRLVHDYDAIDQHVLFAALENVLVDVPTYGSAVTTWLERRREPGG